MDKPKPTKGDMTTARILVTDVFALDTPEGIRIGQHVEMIAQALADERARCARVVSDRAERLRLSAKNDVEMWDETARQKVLKFVEELERLAKAIREGDA